MGEPRPATQTRGRQTFRQTVLTGIPLAALAAVASAKPWLGTASSGANGEASMTVFDQAQRYPAASAISLVLLAGWGVLLVTRGRVRRAFSVLVALASLALLAAVVSGYLTLPDARGPSYDQLMGRPGGSSGFTAWFWTAAVSSVLAVPPALAAVRLVPTWPEMGSRYDAPGSRDREVQEPRVETERDLWEQIDEGRDPTDRPHP